VCSEGLADTRRPRRPDLVVIPNAVDVGHFRQPRTRPSDLPPGPVAVYVGTLHEDRLDVDLLCRLAMSEPELAIALVGPVSLRESSTSRLSALANVHLLGPRPYGEVPAYLQHADVVIVPHVVSPFTESLDPIKAYECLAVGRPTVATPVAGFRGLGDPVLCAEGSDFVATVRTLAGAGRVPDQPRVVPAWADRAGEFDALLIEVARSADPTAPFSPA
jgi:teichuronic acid biosynthesis glycosyltransferase TuaH